MTTLVPRAPYTPEELRSLYPAGLDLQYVQVLLRHGERSPVSPRFQNAGLPVFWPYCSAARHLKSAVMDSPSGDHFGTLEWKRRLEAFGPGDQPVLAAGPRGELDAICDMGMLTDRGRETTFALGARLRALYVEQLRFLPPQLASTDSLYLRATPMPRALESVQETFTGLYPPHTRHPELPPPSIVSRAPADETLFPNEAHCRRFAALSRAFAQRAADRWNASDDMAYLSRLWGKWMPADARPNSHGPVAVDSKPRLSGIMDTVNSTLAHGPETRLPREFYDPRARQIIERIGVEEWFAGYRESREYRALGIGALMGDVVSRMVGSAEQSSADGEYEIARRLDQVAPGPGAASSRTPVRLGLSGCHDTTLAAVLASLGAFDTEKWPPYTSHIAIELFRKSDSQHSGNQAAAASPTSSTQEKPSPVQKSSGWFSSLFSGWSSAPGTPPAGGIGRKRTDELSPQERAAIDGYFVRLRYNDDIVTVPGCRAPGNHLEGDQSFCTLAAFKSIVDKFVPQDWKRECSASINAPAFPSKPEPAGH